MENLPVGLSEEIVKWYMENYQVAEDAAVGSLCVFLKGEGQPSADLFVAFPELSDLYYKALQESGKMPVEESSEEPVVEEPVVEEPAA